MKIYKSPIMLLATGMMCLGLAACGGGSTGLKYKSGDPAFQYRDDGLTMYYDLSKEAYNVNVVLNLDKVKVKGLRFGRIEATKKQFGYNDGILTISGEILKEQASGEKDMTITLSDGKTKGISALICDKVIKTPQDFQAISENLQGTYILGNDIDFSNFGNFEPLGVYYEETSTSNAYFHGILEGNGYAIRNLKAYYSSNESHTTSTGTYPSNYDVYDGDGLFKLGSHINGDNIGVFQTIGSSGVVRNMIFDNVRVRGRTIVGVIAGNNMGRVENCLITDTCRAEMNTHFYDNDCNVGGAFGIVAGSGVVSHVVSLTTKVSVSEIYTDWDDTYVGKTGNGWDHVSTEGNDDAWWHYCGVDRERQIYEQEGTEWICLGSSGEMELDSNNSRTNGVYSFVGKCWGQVSNSIGAAFSQKIFVSEGSYNNRDVYFGQTHLGVNKPGSGQSDLGQINNCSVLGSAALKQASSYAGFDTSIWSIVEGSYPTLNKNLIKQLAIQ